MTPCTKPVTRLTNAIVRDGGKRRALVITVHAEFIELRPHGTRRAETVSLEAAYFGAIKARVWKDKMDKAKERRERARIRKS